MAIGLLDLETCMRSRSQLHRSHHFGETSSDINSICSCCSGHMFTALMRLLLLTVVGDVFLRLAGRSSTVYFTTAVAAMWSSSSSKPCSLPQLMCYLVVRSNKQNCCTCNVAMESPATHKLAVWQVLCKCVSILRSTSPLVDHLASCVSQCEI